MRLRTRSQLGVGGERCESGEQCEPAQLAFASLRLELSVGPLEVGAGASQFALERLVAREPRDRARGAEPAARTAACLGAVFDRREQSLAKLSVLCELHRELGGAE